MKKLTLLILLFCLGASLGFAHPPKTRVAIVGLEHDHVWGRIKTLLQTPDADLVAIADPQPELIEKAKSRVPSSVEFFRDCTEMLDQVKPDAVVVTTPNSLHLAVVRACARRHINVVTEKPMGCTAAEAREMARLAKAAGIKLMVNYPTLWTPATQAAAARLKAGELGPIQKIIVEFGHQGPKHIGSSPQAIAWLYDPRQGGGALLDFACYGADWAMWVKGRPQRVFAYSLKLRTDEHNKVEDDAEILLEYPDASAILLPSWDYPYTKTQAEFFGPKGSLLVMAGGLLYQPANQRTTIEDPDGTPVATPPLPPEKTDGINYFLDCVRNHKPIEGPVSPELNVGVNEIMDAAMESIRTGKAVSLSPE